MLPESIPVLRGKAAEQFLEYDAKPLSEKEVEFLQQADKLFAKHKPR